jgi:UDP-N-acetyl-D-mannosaminuronic acid dehydrogenase
MEYDICVCGGAGHIGSILSILFADKGKKVLIYDINRKAMDIIAGGKLPFLENGYEKYLSAALDNNNLFFTDKSDDVKNAEVVILTIGTSVDEMKNPRINDIIKCLDDLPIHNNQLLILRSTIYPGVTDYVRRHLKSKNLEPMLAFCPERLVQGNGFNEIQKLPQIVSGIDKKSEQKAANLFKLISPKIIYLDTMEAEFAKLFSNCYRYIEFAATNQFYEMATIAGLDYNKILNGVKEDYPRLRDMPSAGLAGGSCIYKDTAQLCAYYEGKFSLGEAAIQANEGLTYFIASQLEKRYPLDNLTVGLLGMAFKANSDDIRASLSYKLKKILTFKSKQVLTTDPLVPLAIDPTLLPLDVVIEKSDILIICVPHAAYKNIKSMTNKEIINVWNN